MSEPSREEVLSMLFAEMVVQQTNMAVILLGKTPHPQTGKMHKDLNAARMFIDQLEMLDAKTKGNLSKEEEALLKQSLNHLRLAYVQTMNEEGKGEPAKPEPQKPAAEAVPGAAAATEAPQPAEEEPRKKFTKKY